MDTIQVREQLLEYIMESIIYIRKIYKQLDTKI